MNGTKQILLSVMLISYCCCPVQATTYYVEPGESIQAAIDGASYGDTVEVSAGTYMELITLKNGVALNRGRGIGNYDRRWSCRLCGFIHWLRSEYVYLWFQHHER